MIILSACIYFWHIIACVYWAYAVEAVYKGVTKCSVLRASLVTQNRTHSSAGYAGQQLCFKRECVWYGDCNSLKNNVSSSSTVALSSSRQLSNEVPDGWIPHPDLADQSPGEQYLQSLYWALEVTTGIGDDIIPSNEGEILITVLMAVFGLVMVSFIIGNASSLVQSFDNETALQREKLDHIQRYFRRAHVPGSFHRAIVNYYQHTFATPSQESGILEELPESLQLRLTLVLNRDLFVRVPVFAAFSAQKFIEVMEHLISSTYLPGEFITKAGELISNVCFIKLGTVDLLSPTNEMVRNLRRLPTGAADRSRNVEVRTVFFFPSWQLSRAGHTPCPVAVLTGGGLWSLTLPLPSRTWLHLPPAAYKCIISTVKSGWYFNCEVVRDADQAVATVTARAVDYCDLVELSVESLIYLGHAVADKEEDASGTAKFLAALHARNREIANLIKGSSGRRIISTTDVRRPGLKDAVHTGSSTIKRLFG